MLENSNSNYRVDKLRTTLLYRVDFNQMNKVVGKYVMSKAERALILATK